MSTKLMSNADLLARLDSAFKAITIGDLDEGILQPAKFDRFVQAMQHRTMILGDARFIAMESHQVDIDRVGFVGRILKAGLDGDGGSRDLSEGEHVKPSFWTNKLNAKELQAITGIKDAALRRNIERGNFEDTLIDLFGEAAGRDMEEWFVLGNTDIDWAEDAVLSLIDGWAKRAANKIYGVGASQDFDPNGDNWPENMFEAMLTAVPKQYLQNRAEWRIYVDWATENAYRNLLKARSTELGDRGWTQGQAIPYKGLAIQYVPMMERSKAVGTDGGAGRIAMLQHPDNMAWGIFQEVTIERDRIPKSRRTDFVLTLEGDADYEDENAAVTAFIEGETPGS